jgi:hypothetical protein
MQEAIRWLQQATRMVASLALFSRNEQAEDIATADLKYLLVPYLLGEAQSRDSTQDRDLRMQRLQGAAASLARCDCLHASKPSCSSAQAYRAWIAFRHCRSCILHPPCNFSSLPCSTTQAHDSHPCRFLEQCQGYGLLGEAESAALGGHNGQAGQLDPAARRSQKIARFRLEKAAQAKLDAVKLQVSAPLGAATRSTRTCSHLPLLCSHAISPVPESICVHRLCGTRAVH